MSDVISNTGSGLTNITTGATQTQDVSGGTDISKVSAYSVEMTSDNLIPNGAVTVDKKAKESLEDTVLVSGLRMKVKEKNLSISRNRISTNLTLVGEIDDLLQKSVDTSIVYISFSPDEADSFENASRSIIKGRIGDAFGRGAWTNLIVLRDIASLLGFTVVTNIYEYWIKQFEVSDTETIFSAIQKLVNIFKPKLFYRDNVLYVLQAFEPEEWQGLATIPAKVEAINQRESSYLLPKKIRLLGGMGAFDPSKYAGTMRLGSRSGNVTVGEHSYYWRDFGSSETTTETLSEQTFSEDKSSSEVETNKTKTVWKRTSGVDAFGNNSYLRYEQVDKYKQDMKGKEVFDEGEELFNKHEYTHWRYTNPRLTFSAKAYKKKVLKFTDNKDDTCTAAVASMSVGDSSIDVVETKDEKEAIFQETVLTYEKKTGRLKSKVIRKTADIVALRAPTRLNDKSWVTVWKYVPIHEVVTDAETAVQLFKIDDGSGDGTLDTKVPFRKDYPIEIQYTDYKQISKKYYTMSEVTYTLSPKFRNSLVYDSRARYLQIPAGDVPTNRIDYRKMQIWVEKEIEGGTGPTIEISDGNIIDWKQAADILEEISWQFTSNRRYTTFDLVGEIPIDAGVGVKSITLTHAKSGISAESLGEYPIISAISRQKDASSGTSTTTIAVEGRL